MAFVQFKTAVFLSAQSLSWKLAEAIFHFFLFELEPGGAGVGAAEGDDVAMEVTHGAEVG